MTHLLVQEVPNRTQRVTGTDGSHGLPGEPRGPRRAGGVGEGLGRGGASDRGPLPQTARRATRTARVLIFKFILKFQRMGFISPFFTCGKIHVTTITPRVRLRNVLMVPDGGPALARHRAAARSPACRFCLSLTPRRLCQWTGRRSPSFGASACPLSAVSSGSVGGVAWIGVAR